MVRPVKIPRMPARVIAMKPRHGTIDGWVSGCNCHECRDAMDARIHDSGLPRNLSWTLTSMLELRTVGLVLPAKAEVVAWLGRICKRTASQHLRKLVRLGVLAKGTEQADPHPEFGPRMRNYHLDLNALDRARRGPRNIA